MVAKKKSRKKASQKADVSEDIYCTTAILNRHAQNKARLPQRQDTIQQESLQQLAKNNAGTLAYFWWPGETLFSWRSMVQHVQVHISRSDYEEYTGAQKGRMLLHVSWLPGYLSECVCVCVRVCVFLNIVALVRVRRTRTTRTRYAHLRTRK